MGGEGEEEEEIVDVQWNTLKSVSFAWCGARTCLRLNAIDKRTRVCVRVCICFYYLRACIPIAVIAYSIGISKGSEFMIY